MAEIMAMLLEDCACVLVGFSSFAHGPDVALAPLDFQVWKGGSEGGHADRPNAGHSDPGRAGASLDGTVGVGAASLEGKPPRGHRTCGAVAGGLRKVRMS